MKIDGTDIDDGTVLHATAPVVDIDVTTDPAAPLLKFSHTGYNFAALDFVTATGVNLPAAVTNVGITVEITGGSVKTNSRTPKPISGAVHVFDLVIETSNAGTPNSVSF